MSKIYHDEEHVQYCINEMKRWNPCEKEKMELAFKVHDDPIITGFLKAADHPSFPTTQDERIFADIDLAILSDTKRYPEYVKQLNYEYRNVFDFNRIRIEFLKMMLSRKNIYQACHYSEHEARKNMLKEIGDRL